MFSNWKDGVFFQNPFWPFIQLIIPVAAPGPVLACPSSPLPILCYRLHFQQHDFLRTDWKESN